MDANGAPANAGSKITAQEQNHFVLINVARNALKIWTVWKIVTHARICHASVAPMTNAVVRLLFAIMVTAWDALMTLNAAAIQIIATLIILPILSPEFASAEISQPAQGQHQGAKDLEALRPVLHALLMIIALAIINSATLVRTHASSVSPIPTALHLLMCCHYKLVLLGLHPINANVVLMSAVKLHHFARILPLVWFA